MCKTYLQVYMVENPLANEQSKKLNAVVILTSHAETRCHKKSLMDNIFFKTPIFHK